MLPSIESPRCCSPNDSGRVDRETSHVDWGFSFASGRDNVRHAVQVMRERAFVRAYPDAAPRIGGQEVSVGYERGDLDNLLHPAFSDAQQSGRILWLIMCDRPNVAAAVFCQ